MKNIPPIFVARHDKGAVSFAATAAPPVKQTDSADHAFIQLV
jgi:hypothetical protein